MSEEVSSLWLFLAPVHDHIFGLLFSIAVGIFLLVFRPKVRIQWGMTHNLHHEIHGAETRDNIYSENYFVQNFGSQAAQNVELNINPIPTNVEFYPPINNLVFKTRNSNLFVTIPFISPYEQINVNILNINNQPSRLMEVRCQDKISRQKNFWTVRRFSGPINALIVMLMILGVAFVATFVWSIVTQ